VIGFVVVGERARDADAGDGCGELQAIYVDAAGRGVGRALHDAAVAELRVVGCTRALLWVLERNARAIALADLAST
jgi:GNAT superfamily N-acetyltransferase